MNGIIFRRNLGFLCAVALLLSPLAEAQRPGGGTIRPTMPTRPATPPNLSAAQSYLGNNSVIHRDVAPTPTRTTIQRPNSSQPSNRPNPSGQNLRNVDRSNVDRSNLQNALQNIDRSNTNINRQTLDQVRQNFGPDNRNQVFKRTDNTVINRDGPDWKNWQNFNPQRINNTVINKIDIDNRSINVVRDNFNKQYNRNDFFTKDWYVSHPGAWHPGWHDIDIHVYHHWWWRHPSWDNAWGWFAAGFFAGAVTNAVLTPVPYYYGSNIVYVQDTVYVNNVPYVSSSEYYRQAQSIAQAGAVQATPAATVTDVNVNVNVNAKTDAQPEEKPADEWLPMGTFAVVADGKQTESKRILQIASNKQGQVRGNFINQETNTATELYGSVDPQTQRVAFKAVGNDSLVAECGFWNLTQDTVPLLVHLDANRTEERTLIRLTDTEPEA